MNCDKCQDLLSEFLGETLEHNESLAVYSHLEECGDCREMFKNLRSILESESFDEVTMTASPDSESLWCSIRQSIEPEAKDRREEAKERNASRRIWRLSLPQLAGLFASVAILAAGFTFVILRSPDSVPDLSDVPEEPSAFTEMLAAMGLAETPRSQREERIKQFEAAIEYWEKRIQAKKVQWDGRLKDAFERNKDEIDKMVEEYATTLERNPDDDLAHEMLEAALYEKEGLLKTFAGL